MCKSTMELMNALGRNDMSKVWYFYGWETADFVPIDDKY